MLHVNHISKKFQDIPILKDVSLHANYGDLVHISGGNGSGKSTIFKIITRLLNEDTGSVQIDKNDVIGALIENPGFLEYETALENLKFLGDLNNKYDSNVINELMTQFDLDFNNKQSVSKYSVGMRQKLGIIQSVMEQQNIILLDEPTRGLDTEGIKQFTLLVKKLILNKKIVIIASHDHIENLEYTQEFKLENGVLSRV